MSLHYKKHEHDLKAIARKWSRVSNLGVDELESEANLVYAKCLKKYDPHKGKFKNYLMSSVWNCLKTYVNKNKQIELPEEMTHRWQGQPFGNPEETAVFYSLLETLSDDAGIIVDSILDANDELFSIARHVGRVTRGVLRTHFRKLKWSHYRIDNAFKEIKRVL